MAIPIRSIPVLEGEVAERFLREARKVEENPGKGIVSKKMQIFLRKVNDDLRNSSRRS